MDYRDIGEDSGKKRVHLARERLWSTPNNHADQDRASVADGGDCRQGADSRGESLSGTPDTEHKPTGAAPGRTPTHEQRWDREAGTQRPCGRGGRQVRTARTAPDATTATPGSLPNTGIASDTCGSVSATRLWNTVRDSRMVTPEITDT